MAILITDFVAALNTLKLTGEAQSIGSFKLSNVQPDHAGSPGLRVEQHCLRIDPLGYDAPFYSVVQGGMRYWPASKYGIRKLAERLLARETAEMESRALHLRAVAGPSLVCNETAYGSTQRLSFAIKCF